MPKRVFDSYIVPAGRQLPDPTALVLELIKQLTGVVGEVAANRFAHPIYIVDVMPREELPFHIGDGLVSPVELAAFEGAVELIRIQMLGRAGNPYGAWAARGAAVVLAEHLEAPVLDGYWLRSHAHLRRSIDDDPGLLSVRGWITVPYSLHEGLATVTTVGLGRYGLPELKSTGVPARLAPEWAAVIGAAAEVLFQFWWWRLDIVNKDGTLDSLDLPPRLPVKVANVEHRTNTPASGREGSVDIRLELDDSDGGPWLSLNPMLDWTRSSSEWMAETVSTLFGPRRSDMIVVTAGDDPRLIAATSRARSELAGVRRRLLDGKLPVGAHVMVRFRRIEPEGTGNFWATVTGWGRYSVVRGVCDSDHGEGSGIRPGLAIEIPERDITDWAIFTDADGLVEGYYSQGVIGGYLDAAGIRAGPGGG